MVSGSIKFVPSSRCASLDKRVRICRLAYQQHYRFLHRQQDTDARKHPTKQQKHVLTRSKHYWIENMNERVDKFFDHFLLLPYFLLVFALILFLYGHELIFLDPKFASVFPDHVLKWRAINWQTIITVFALPLPSKFTDKNFKF